MRLIDEDILKQELKTAFKEVGGECVDNIKRKHPETDTKQMRATILANLQLVIDTINELPEIKIDEQWAAKNINKWILCSNKLPDKDGIYLVSCKKYFFGVLTNYNKRAHTAVFRNGAWLGAEDFRKSIIAWMPLPEPYKE